MILSNYESAFIFDLSWLLYRGFHANSELIITLPEGGRKPVGHIFSVLQSLVSASKRNHRAMMIYAVDGVSFRKDYDPTYKQHREKTGFNVHNDEEEVLNALMVGGAFTARGDRLEADDVLFSLAGYLKRKLSGQIRIVSSDMDLYQALDIRVSMVKSLSKDKMVDFSAQDVRSKFGVDPEYFYFYKAITGDDSDNIRPVIPRFPRKVIKEMGKQGVTEDTLDSFVPATKSEQKWIDLLKEHRGALVHNINMVKLIKKEVKVSRKGNKPQAEAFLSRHRMSSYINFLKSRKLL